MPVEFLLTILTVSQTFKPDSSEVKDLSGHRVIFTIDDGYRSVYDYIYPLLKKYRMSATLGLIVNYIGTGKAGYGSPSAFLTRQQIKEMMDSVNIEIASHTLSHPWLTRLDDESAYREIYLSKVILESLFNVPVITFIYPYGDMDQRIRRLVRKVGYRMARAVRSGEINLWIDPYRLPEFELRRETSLEAVKRHIQKNPVTILLVHRIVEKPTRFTEWSIDDFTALVEWLHQNRVRTMTLADLYYEWQQEITKNMLKEPPWGLRGIESLFKEVDVDATRTYNPR